MARFCLLLGERESRRSRRRRTRRRQKKTRYEGSLFDTPARKKLIYICRG